MAAFIVPKNAFVRCNGQAQFSGQHFSLAPLLSLPDMVQGNSYFGDAPSNNYLASQMLFGQMARNTEG
jgi:hypothetical protein